MEKNPVTGIKEPYFPERDRIPRIMSGVAAIIVMVRYLFAHIYAFFSDLFSYLWIPIYTDVLPNNVFFWYFH